MNQLVLNSFGDVLSNVTGFNFCGYKTANESLNSKKKTVNFLEVSNGVYIVTHSIGNTTKTIKVLKS